MSLIPAWPFVGLGELTRRTGHAAPHPHRPGADRLLLSAASHPQAGVFCSVLREDFRPDSDVDVLVEFEPGHARIPNRRYGRGALAAVGRPPRRSGERKIPQPAVAAARRPAQRCTMQKDDLVYAGHMLDTARKAAGKVVGKTRQDDDQDENLAWPWPTWFRPWARRHAGFRPPSSKPTPTSPGTDHRHATQGGARLPARRLRHRVGCRLGPICRRSSATWKSPVPPL